MSDERTLLQRVDELAQMLLDALVNQELHARGSADEQAELGALARAIASTCAAGVGSPFVLTIGTKCLAWRDTVLLGASLQSKRLLDVCRARGVGEIAFDERVSADELARFLQALATDASPAALAQRGITHVKVTAQGPVASGPTAPDLAPYQDLAEVLHESHVAATRGEDLEMDKAQGLVEMALSHMDDAPSSLLSLAGHDQIDSFTVGHSVRVALLALHVARAAGASKQGLLRVGTAALLHDIGKSRVPQQILFKRGILDAEERAIIAQHPRFGAEILLQQRHIDEAAIGAAFCHHMGPNRTGYPRPLLDFEPSAISKLVRVCDVFEAMTAARPYKRPLTPLQAYTVMRRTKEGFDPRWFRFFVHALGVYPIGTRVVLDDASIAVVIAQGDALDRPVVRRTTGDPETRVVTIGVAEDGLAHEIRAVAGAAVPGTEPTPPSTCC